MRLNQPVLWLIVLLSATGYLLLNYSVVRQDTGQVIGLYLGLTAMAAWIAWRADTKQTSQLIWIGVGFRALLLFSIPNLSDDFYRFLWDGSLTSQGLSPFAFLPSEVPGANVPDLGSGNAVVASKDFYSVYPPLCQLLFWVARTISPGSVLGGVVILKVSILLMEVGTILLMRHLLHRWNHHPRLLLLYALNPLVIIELTGNMHFEAAMIFFVLLAVALLAGGRILMSAMALGLAVSAKLLPLILLPFLIKRIGPKRAVVYGAVCLATFVVLFLPLGMGYLSNMFESLRLYYQTFEFNAGIYYALRWVGDLITGYNLIYYLGPALSLAILAFVIRLALRERSHRVESLLTPALLSLGFYHLLSTTVNPWYITPLIAFSIFTRYRFALLWGATIPLSYHAFGYQNFHESVIVIAVQYIPVITLFAYETLRGTDIGKAFQRWHVNARGRIKLRRLLPYLRKEELILDIGSGNCGLVRQINEGGFSAQPLDVVNKSAFEGTIPIIYDGKTVPFDDNSFDTTLLITMLHHTQSPQAILAEAVRVSRSRLIVMEDVFTNKLQKRITFWLDSLVNWEFGSHPHTNKTEDEWQELFKRLGLTVAHKSVHRTLLVFRQVTYVLEK